MKGFAALLLLLAACSASDAFGPGDDPADDTDSDDFDATDSGDCETFLEPQAALVQVGTNIVADVRWEGLSSGNGVDWAVENPGEDVFTGFTVVDVSPGHQRLTLPADQAGSWEIRVQIDGCGAEERRLVYALADNAGEASYRLRFYPRAEDDLPAFETEPVVVASGGPYEMPLPPRWPDSLPLDDVLSLVRDGSSLPLAAQLSLRPKNGGLPVVLHADQSGHYQGSVVYDSYEVVVVPYEAEVAPVRRELHAIALAEGFSIDTGQPVTGWIKDAAGNGVPSKVALASAGMPASIVHTSPEGFFSGFADAPGALEVRVTPDDHEKLGLFADDSLALVPGELDIRLPEVIEVDVELTVTSAASTVMPGAHVRAISTGVGGTVQQAGQPPRDARRTGRRSSGPTDADGKVVLRLPTGPYTLVVEPPEGNSDTMASQEIVVVGPGTQKLALKSAERASATLRLSGGDDDDLAGTKVIAVSRGLHGLGAGTSVAGAPSEVAPTFSLSLVPGVAYDVLVVPRANSGLLRQSVTIPAGASGEIPVVLSRGVQLRGRAQFNTRVVRHARVVAVCAACDDPDRELAETSTGSSGTFRLQVPDPGPKTP